MGFDRTVDFKFVLYLVILHHITKNFLKLNFIIIRSKFYRGSVSWSDGVRPSKRSLLGHFQVATTKGRPIFISLLIGSFGVIEPRVCRS